jgi:NAD(P)-dependent dehydrogenase (short-subunit alcohol dehydrogenase family)
VIDSPRLSGFLHYDRIVPTLLVFGARNLGRAIARHFAADGWNVAAVARSQESLSRLAADVPGALTVAGDASKVIDVERAFAETRMRFAVIDLVVVAISPTGGMRRWGGGEVAESEPADFAPYLDELLPATINVLRIGSRLLKQQGHGTYVQITGGSARRGRPGIGAWAATAFAGRGLLQAAAGELRQHGVHTALLIVDATIESEKTQERLAGKPPELSATEEDVARAIAYLASQSERGWTHELQITPRGDAWVP